MRKSTRILIITLFLNISIIVLSFAFLKKDLINKSLIVEENVQTDSRLIFK